MKNPRPKFYLRNGQMMVQWECPTCGGPVTQPTPPEANYKKFAEMYVRFHALEQMCPGCVMEVVRCADHKILSQKHDILA